MGWCVMASAYLHGPEKSSIEIPCCLLTLRPVDQTVNIGIRKHVYLLLCNVDIGSGHIFDPVIPCKFLGPF